MVAGSKYGMPSSSPDGSTYTNGQRGPYGAGAASLEKSGSFREGGESRMTSSLAGMTKPGSTLSQGDTNNLFQSLISDLRPVVLDQKFPRLGEMRRSISNILGVSSEDSIPATFNLRHLPSSAMEEIRRTRSTLNESAAKARDRSKAFVEAVSKIDKYGYCLPRKHSRVDMSSSERPNVSLPGGSNSKTGPQISSGLENGTKKLEERAKSAVPNRRVRTSREGRVDAWANGISTPSGPVDRDKDVYKLVNGGAIPSEEKGQALPTGVDGLEKSKMKKKRSVIKSDASATAFLGRPLDGDQEPKRGMQQKLISDTRPRLNNTHGFRSGPVTAVSGIGNSDSSQQNGLSMRPIPRNGQSNGILPIDRRDRPISSNKDGATLRVANKSNSREDTCAASSTETAQFNASARGPRSNSGSQSKASPTIHRALGNSDDWEHPQCVNKLNNTVGAINCKRSTSARSPSPPVAWGGQRPQKITRVARRSNLTPAISGHNEISALDMVDNAAINEDGLTFSRRLSCNASQQSKLKNDHAPPSGLSESEESGPPEDQSKDKGKTCSETEEKAGPTVQKVATLLPPSKRNKVVIDDDLGDGIRRQRRIGRGFGPRRSGIPAAIEKLDNTQCRSAQIGSEKIESKPGRPPTKKWSERKAYTRPRHYVNNAPIEFAGESDDDHEELLAAANAALDTRHACSSPFWEQMKPVFDFLSAEDIIFLNQMNHLMDGAAASTCFAGDALNLKGDVGDVLLPSTPAFATRDDCGAVSNGVSLHEHDRAVGIATQTEHAEPFLEHLVRGNGVSICQTLLSAIIEEEEIENFSYANSKGEEHIYDDVNGMHFEFDEELVSKGSNLHSAFQALERVPSIGYRINAGRRYHAQPAFEKLRCNGISLEQNVEGNALDELFTNRTTPCVSMYTEVQYNQMSIDGRILLELSEIGLYPEPVPDLVQSEEEEISKGINVLEEKLHEQVMKKRSLISKLEKAVMDAREHQPRILEHIALDKLVGLAYEKYMACWGPNSSGSKNVNKATKHAALAFVRRALARYQKFEETGSSCFNKPAFRDMFLFVSSLKRGDVAADGEPADRLGSSLQTEIISTDHKASLALQPVQSVDTQDAFQSVNHLSDQMIDGDDLWSNKVKKRELLLDDVVGGTVGTSLRAPSGLGGSLPSGAKGKRSEREREGKGQNRDAVCRYGTAKIGRPSSSNIRGERKNKTKSKQRTAQLSASVNGLLSKPTGLSSTILPSALKSGEKIVGGSTKKDDSGLPSSHAGMQDLSNDAEAADLSNLQLPDLDGDFGGQGQDIASWLNIDEDGLQDHDYMGLEIPMDDLSDVL